MGTLVRVTVYVEHESAAREGFAAAFERIRQIDAILSDYREDSELNAVARSAVGRPVPVSPDLFQVLQASQELAAATGGAFDITQGPVVRLWREARRSGRPPDPAALRDAASRSGYRKLHLDPERRTIRIDAAGMQLDVGAIGKGYAAGEALATLAALGIEHALVAVSGDLAFGKAPPGRHGWRIRLHAGELSPDGVPESLELTGAAVSTSGSSAQHLEVDGRRYSHIVDPASSTGLVDDLQVTVVARTGLEADGLSTAVSVLGIDRGLALVEGRPGAAALIVRRTGAGAVPFMSSAFRELAGAR